MNTIVLIKSQTFYLVISVEPNSVLGDSNTHIVKVRSRNRQGREKRKRKIQVISRMLGSCFSNILNSEKKFKNSSATLSST